MMKTATNAITESSLSMDQALQEELEQIKSEHLYRTLRTLTRINATEAMYAGKKIMLFCGNDYLGLGFHPKIVSVFRAAAAQGGVGSSASRLISGTMGEHTELEQTIARFKHKEKAIVFSSGYLANIGILQALCGTNDLIVADKLNHASLIDAAKLSGSVLRVYPHGDVGYLEKLLKNSAKFRRKIIVTDSVFSMDGDIAPLKQIAKLKKAYDAWLMIDEAHGTGVFGLHGRGVAEELEIESEIDIAMGTMSKAVGTFGGFVAGSSALIDTLINKSRSFIFTTALPPAVCQASIESFRLIESDNLLRKRLRQRVSQIHEWVSHRNLTSQALHPHSPIISIHIGPEDAALQVSEKLLAHQILIPAVRYPAVPKNKARLRLTVSAAHSEEQIKTLLNVLNQVLPRK